MRNKTLQNRLTAQFYRGNMPMPCLAVFASLVSGTLNLILSWIMQQLIDSASGVPGALPLGLLAKLCGISAAVRGGAPLYPARHAAV